MVALMMRRSIASARRRGSPSLLWAVALTAVAGFLLGWAARGGQGGTRRRPLLPSVFETQVARPPVMYGHVHVGKTGGTSLNGNLSMQFERVCGNKGYSFSAYQANEQVANGTLDPFRTTIKGKQNLLTNVNSKTMDTIGYEDCDYVSNEFPWKFWRQFSDFHGTQMELHVPCRDPLDHLMSGCNYRWMVFDCANKNETEMFKQARVCIGATPSRFRMDLARLPNVHLKCFDFRKASGAYMDYIAPKLQRRRITKPYVFRSTNRPRDKTGECLWKDKRLMKKLRGHLIGKYDYYEYCDACLGTKNDITSARFVEPKY